MPSVATETKEEASAANWEAFKGAAVGTAKVGLSQRNLLPWASRTVGLSSFPLEQFSTDAVVWTVELDRRRTGLCRVLSFADL